MSPFNYLHDPAEIERRSFERIRQLIDLAGLAPQEQQVALRLVHTCGDPGIVDTLFFGEGAASAGLGAIARNAPVLCDVEMVRHGLNRRYLPNPVHCFLNAAGIRERANARGETRTMAALSLWGEFLGGSIVAIGNAPTALFRLLEMLIGGAPRPALIIAMPVGFIGAEESKEALIAYATGADPVPCMTLRGRRGGSALTAATLNALARLAQGIRC
jgi:precorrin-8X/cobalt-precorrin-8 methylmutase